jgi:hypothetical protein
VENAGERWSLWHFTGGAFHPYDHRDRVPRSLAQHTDTRSSTPMASGSMSRDAADGSDNGSGEIDVVVEPEFRPFFWLFAAAALVLFYFAMGYARKYRTMAAFVLPVRRPCVLNLNRVDTHCSLSLWQPFICLCMLFDNLVMATTGIQHDKPVVQAMLAFHSCVIPMTLLVCYEIAYHVHKQKSVNFCGISFESGHRRLLGRNALSTCLRFSVWLVGVALLVMNLMASYRWRNESPDIKSIYDLEGDSTTHAVFTVAPALVLVVLSLYIGLQLWNYGTFYSYMVHATCFNPWIWMLVGSVTLLAGYLMPTPIYPLTSNGGELVMLATVVRMFREVHHDIQQGQQMRNFIDPISTVSPQSTSRSGVLLSQGQGGKYSPMGGGGGGASGGGRSSLNGASSTYLEVFTPRAVEQLELTVDDATADTISPAHHRLGTSAATTTLSSPSSSSSNTLLSVVVSSTRTNPLFD